MTGPDSSTNAVCGGREQACNLPAAKLTRKFLGKGKRIYDLD